VVNDKDTLEPAEIAEFYREAFRALGPKLSVPPISVEFYSYVGINHTIRIRAGGAFIRIAEMCRDMPADAHRDLAYILVSKLLRKRKKGIDSDAYHEYIKTAEMRERAAESKRTRGRKVITSSTGAVYDLESIFDDLNAEYFESELPKPVITWSAKKTFRILGHHDAAHDTIVISRSLDAADVPKFVVDYVLFHEMLHIAHPTVHHNGRRYYHTPAFRRDERKFPMFDRAEKWITDNVRRMKRNARKK
jgi:predicted metal-dependent hydrolase